jgi:D-tyrosyl-tRNA(Tyr) deacylase
MIKQTGGEESDENLKKLIELVVTCEAVHDPAEKQWYEYQYRPFGYSELHKEEREVQKEYEISQIKLKRHFEEYVGERIETCENQEYGNIS